MAEQEFYRLDLVVSADGVEVAQEKLRTLDKVVEQTKQRGNLLRRARFAPTAELEDRLSAPAKRVTSTMTRIARTVARPTIGLEDRLSAPAKKAAAPLKDMDRHRVEPKADLKDEVTPSARRVMTTLKGIAGKAWNVTVRLKDVATSPIASMKRAGSIAASVMPVEVPLQDEVTPSVRRITTTLKGIAGKTWTVAVVMKDLVTAPLGALKRGIGSIARTAVSLPSIIAGSAATYAGVFKPLQLAGDMEQSQIAFDTMLGSASKAAQFLGEITDFAIKTPFEFPEVRDSSKRMLAFGFTAERIIPMLTGVGNAAAGLSLGSAGVDRITLALGQMKAKAKVSGDEMLQLTEAGIPAWDILAKKMGITTGQVMKLSEKGLIPADKAIDALIDGMNERFPNMMDRQSKSLFGLWNSIKETFSTKILMRWGDGIARGIKPNLDRLATWIDNNQDKIERWGSRFSEVSFSAASALSGGFEKAFNTVKSRYLDNPDFKALDLKGKISFIVDDLWKSFDAWYGSGGSDQITGISSKLVSNLADAIKANAGPITDAGLSLGGSLAKGILEGLAQNLKETNKAAIENPTKDNILSAAALDIGVGAAAGWGASKLFKLVKPLKGLFTKAPKSPAGGVAPTAREVIKAPVPGEPGFNPRYQTPPKPDTPLPKKYLPGIPTAGNFVRQLIAPEILIPSIAGGIISNQIHQQREQQRSQYMEQFKNDPYMLEQATKPFHERMTVNSGKPIQDKVTVPTPTIEISDQQYEGLTNYLKNLTAETTNEINVNVPPGAVQVQIQNPDVDYDEISRRVGWEVTNEIRKQIENKP